MTRILFKLIVWLLLAALLLAANWHAARTLNRAQRHYATEWIFAGGRWQFDNASLLNAEDGRLRVRLLAPQASLRVESSSARLFVIELENPPVLWELEHHGLASATALDNRIECAVAANTPGELRIAPSGASQDLQFVAVSNLAGNPRVWAALRRQCGVQTEFAVCLGHLSDADSSHAMLAAAQRERMPPLYLCRSAQEPPLGRDLIGFERGPYYFLLLGDFAPGGDALQVQWLVSELRRRSRYAAGIFIFCNRPLLDTGVGRFANPDAAEAATLLEAFKANKVKMVLCGYPVEPYEAPARLTGLYHSAERDGITQVVTVSGSGEAGSDPHCVQVSLHADTDGQLRATLKKIPLDMGKSSGALQRAWFRVQFELATQQWLLWLDVPLLLLFGWLLFRRAKPAPPPIQDPERA